jgi:ferric-dicitrate binding protein FerR (iron transport regulator)
MKFPSHDFDNAVAALCHGTVSDDALTELHELLRADADARDEYLWRVEVHGKLATGSLDFSRSADIDETDNDRKAIATPPLPANIERRWNIQSTMIVAALLILVALGGGLWMRQNSRPTEVEPETVARFADLRDSRWMDPTTQVSSGDAIRNGRRIELSSGSVEVLFNTGARLRIVGPTIVEPRTDNSVFLTLGEVHLVAETPESKGFTVVTPTSRFVDISTAFSARVSPDGLSRLNVSEGEVDVVLEGTDRSPRLRTGETLYVEPGERQVMARIEEGDGTVAFRFPTIQPPSGEDYADQSSGLATIRVASGELRMRGESGRSGPVTLLIDGTGQSHQDAPHESVFFEDQTSGGFLIDLGQEVSIAQINSFSWHQHETNESHRHRARQRFTLYGYAGDQLPDITLTPSESGWTRIARVNSDRFFEVSTPLERPAQQASSITAAQGEIGRFRYLLWEVTGNTFFGEIDVFATPELKRSNP